jgi:hypothetical protein
VAVPPPSILVVAGPVRRPDGTLVVPAGSWAVMTAGPEDLAADRPHRGDVLAVCPTEQAADAEARRRIFADAPPDPDPYPTTDIDDDLDF